MIVTLAVALLCVTAWAVPNASVQPPVTISVDGEASGPTRHVRVPGDIPAGYQAPPPPASTVGEPPQLVNPTDGGEPAGPPPLWGPDATVYGGDIKWLSDQKSERMIAYDQTTGGVLFAAFTVPNGDTAKIYRSTDGGNTWAYWNAILHNGNVLTSLELVVAEGDSSFVFFFVKSSAGNGDIYVGRWAIDGSTANLFSVKVDADTVANLAACRDIGNPYYLYVAYERRVANYGMYQLRSTNYGKTWAATGGEVVNNQTSPKPDICYGRGGNVYTVLRDLRQSSTDSVTFRLRRSTDRGTTWLGSEQIGTTVVPIYDPVVGARHSDSTVWLVHSRTLSANLNIYCYTSTDNGASWSLGSIANTDADEQMPSIACNVSQGDPTLSYTVTPGESIMFTWCSGDTNWTTPEKVNDHRGTGFFASQAGWKDGDGYSTVLYAGYTALGLYFDAWSMTGMEGSRLVAQKPAPLVARPSPARDRTVISYSLPRAGHARVSVVDVTGREVLVLADGAAAAGAHSVAWDCAGVPAGVYLIRVDTSTGSQTGRIVVSH